MKNFNLKTVTDFDTAQIFLGQMVAILGHAFHPDTPAHLYVHDTGKDVFTKKQCIIIDENMKACFQYHDDVYTCAVCHMEEWEKGNVYLKPTLTREEAQKMRTGEVLDVLAQQMYWAPSYESIMYVHGKGLHRPSPLSETVFTEYLKLRATKVISRPALELTDDDLLVPENRQK